jgi:diaminopimelate epimerase
MSLNFVKMEGLGNDFILIDNRASRKLPEISFNTLAKKLCDRRFGIGADGILVISDSKDCDLGFRIFNSDGSEAQMCGNGMRCLARHAYESGITDKIEFTVETLAGVIVPRVNLDEGGRIQTVTVDMGEPVLVPEKIPFKASRKDTLTETVSTSMGEVTFTAISMGNPHAVIFVDNADKAPVAELGPVMEHSPLFPEKTNVEFIEVLSESELRMRVWERGAGITLACGTGACAAVVAAILTGRTQNKVLIHLDGGDLTIEWNRDTNHILKTGPSKLVFEGRVQIK